MKESLHFYLQKVRLELPDLVAQLPMGLAGAENHLEVEIGNGPGARHRNGCSG